MITAVVDVVEFPAKISVKCSHTTSLEKLLFDSRPKHGILKFFT
jgi:hypothetical protein